MSGTSKFDVDEVEIIKLYRRDRERRLRELAAQYIDGAGDREGKVSDTVLSPGLKLSLKVDKGPWKKGSLWMVVDPAAHNTADTKMCTPDQIMVTHVDSDGSNEDMVVMKSELDDTFELQ